MAILSLEHSDQLYWLGRYSERVYTTIHEYEKRFDSLIELKEEDYDAFCKAQDIPNIYNSKDDFIQRYCFDENDTNSIYSNLIRAYDNAVVLREEIGSETAVCPQVRYDEGGSGLSSPPWLRFADWSTFIWSYPYPISYVTARLGSSSPVAGQEHYPPSGTTLSLLGFLGEVQGPAHHRSACSVCLFGPRCLL